MDALGAYTAYDFTWGAAHKSQQLLETSIRKYANLNNVVFQQKTLAELTNMQTTTGDTRKKNIVTLTSAFPSFNASSELMFLEYSDICLTGTRVEPWGSGERFVGGTYDAGPVLFYNDSIPGLPSVVWGPMENFQTAVSSARQGRDQLSFGFNGKMRSLPKGWTHSILLSFGHDPTASLLEWGDALMKYYNTKRTPMDANPTLRSLGYATDNGAYYYYETLPNENYEQTIKTVNSALHSSALPTQMYQFDSWWYYKGPHDGCVKWEAMPSIFPDGLGFLGGSTQLWLHGRFWSKDNVYWHNYTFYTETTSPADALPLETTFFEHIFSVNKPYGLILYEQDWMSNTLFRMNGTYDNVHKADEWLFAMAAGAAKVNVFVQYDSAYAGQILHGVKYSNVHQGSSHIDYRPGNSQWRNTLHNLLHWTAGLVPWKDGFWTTETQTGCRYVNESGCYEPNPHLQTVMALLTGGPVTNGDKLNMWNTTLLSSTCRSDGVLLKASRPLFPLAMAFKMARKYNVDKTLNPFGLFPHIGHTFSKIPGSRAVGNFHIVMAAANLTETRLNPVDLPNAKALGTYLAHELHDPDKIFEFSPKNPIVVPELKTTGTSHAICFPQPCQVKVPFRLWNIAPVWPCKATNCTNFVFLGEQNKIVAVSEQRVDYVSHDETTGHLTARILGAADEKVILRIAEPAGRSWTVLVVSCTFGYNGVAELQCTTGPTPCSCIPQ
eukprot:TRINITY_DN54879_c0_g1_i1.p1 TRINITY_DN54879_c0_g1~~TRINITY_DN54879_c0_g1_i1.p1  ORF type:complete len:804 (-),score=53.29 TRINITY_DN54879_c0_g1_i1:1245-3407(-)